ncbi:MAG: hypothetical protein ACREV9_14085 [Burkholderiales bacterium]
MSWTNYVGGFYGAAVPIDNNVEASAAYSAFIMDGGEEVENVTFAQFLSEYWRMFPAEGGEDI